jgi:hypothetical protein
MMLEDNMKMNLKKLCSKYRRKDIIGPGTCTVVGSGTGALRSLVQPRVCLLLA